MSENCLIIFLTGSISLKVTLSNVLFSSTNSIKSKVIPFPLCNTRKIIKSLHLRSCNLGMFAIFLLSTCSSADPLIGLSTYSCSSSHNHHPTLLLAHILFVKLLYITWRKVAGEQPCPVAFDSLANHGSMLHESITAQTTQDLDVW